MADQTDRSAALAAALDRLALSTTAPPLEHDAAAPPEPAQQQANNAVPWRRARRPPASAAAAAPPPPASLAHVLEDGGDGRPVLLFDLNGVLTSHTRDRRLHKKNRPRPGVAHLRRLSPAFRLGVFSSATLPTVSAAVAMLDAAAGPGPPLFDAELVLHRAHCAPAAAAHVAAHGRPHRPWDTVKPLGRLFGGEAALRRVLVVDNDEYKATPGERANFVLVREWVTGDAGDGVLAALADALLARLGGLPPGADVRLHTAAVAEAVAAAAPGAGETAAGGAAATASAPPRPPPPPPPRDVAAVRKPALEAAK